MATDHACLRTLSCWVLCFYLWHPATSRYDALGLALLFDMRWQAGLYAAKIYLSSLDELPKAPLVAFAASGPFAFFAAMPQFHDHDRRRRVDHPVWVGRAGTDSGPVCVIVRWLRRTTSGERLLLVRSGASPRPSPDSPTTIPTTGSIWPERSGAHKRGARLPGQTGRRCNVH